MARYDNKGLFWEDKTYTRQKGVYVIPPMPSIPETGWRAPTTFPNLSAARCIAIDTETYDPELDEKGPGWARGSGHLIGISVATEDAQWYFPIRHETNPEQNLDPVAVLQWLRVALGNPNQPKIGANLTYDVGWLRHEGVHVAGELVDVLYAEALLVNSKRINLNSVSEKYLGAQKETDLMYQWLEDWHPRTAKSKLRKWMYLTPPSLAGAYAEQDARLPFDVIKHQYHYLRQQGLVELFQMECELIRILIDMRFEGVSVDVNKAEETRDYLVAAEAKAQDKLDKMAGMHVEVSKSASLALAFQAVDVKYPFTPPSDKHPHGQPSFKKEFLESVNHPIGQAVRDVRNLRKTRADFIESAIIGKNVDGKLYCQFHPLKGESGGAGSGRFASSDPNLQQVPSRDKILAPLTRGIFVPDDGHVAWRKYDYSQIEYRFLAHFAKGPHAYKIVDAYGRDPNTDYHTQTGNNIERVTGKKLSNRGHIKNINFGLAYGMGKAKLIHTLGVSKAAGDALFDAYHIANPFVADTFDYYTKQAENQGYITTALGRRSRFEDWVPEKYSKESVTPLGYEAARSKWGNIRRANTHKALNNVLQGSSADLIKKAMIDCQRAGIFDYIGTPRLTVHDELDFSDRGGVDDGFREMKHVMETCMSLRVPVIADCDLGADWGCVKEVVGDFSPVRESGGLILRV